MYATRHTIHDSNFFPTQRHFDLLRRIDDKRASAFSGMLNESIAKKHWPNLSTLLLSNYMLNINDSKENQMRHADDKNQDGNELKLVERKVNNIPTTCWNDDRRMRPFRFDLRLLLHPPLLLQVIETLLKRLRIIRTCQRCWRREMGMKIDNILTWISSIFSSLSSSVCRLSSSTVVTEPSTSALIW